MPLKSIMLALIATLALAIAGCAKEEGTMEKVGKSLDEAAESAEKAAKDAADEVKEAVEE